MKKISLIFIAFLIVGSSYAKGEQFLRIGPKIGVSSSNINVRSGIEDIRYNLKSGNARLGFHIGAFARISVLGFYIQPEALFTSAGGRVTLEDLQTGGEVIRNYTLNKFDVPVMIGNKFAGIFRFQVGPVFSTILNQSIKEDVSGTVTQIKQGWRDAAVGYQVGLGLDIGKVILDLKYEGNLSKVGDSINIGGQPFNTDLRNNQVILSLGWSLL
jgi:opacity protein-like surface antigen